MNYCNSKAIAETIVRTGESQKAVEHAVSFYSAFTAERIREGGFESVRFPHFGIFKAKLKEIQMRNFIRSLPKTTTRKKS